MTLIQWGLFFVVVIPISTLIHEIGHALAIVGFTKKGVAKIYLGEIKETNRRSFHIGRIHFHLKWGLTGFCSYSVDKAELSKWKRIVFMLFGPLVSLLFLLMLYLVVHLTQPIDFIWELMKITMIFTFFQFLFTIAPIYYPSWLGGYGGRPSDGYQALQIAKEKSNKRKNGE